RWSGGVRGTPLTTDARRIVAAQSARALAYGLGSVLIGVTLASRGLSEGAVGLVLAAILTGAALVSVVVGRYGDRFGRRRFYRVVFVLMAAAGTVVGLTGGGPARVGAGLTGAVAA